MPRMRRSSRAWRRASPGTNQGRRPEDVIAAVHSPRTARSLLGVARAGRWSRRGPRTSDRRGGRVDARDLEVLKLLVQGLPTSQIAARLYPAPKTIRNRISGLVGRLGVTFSRGGRGLAKAARVGLPKGRARRLWRPTAASSPHPRRAEPAAPQMMGSAGEVEPDVLGTLRPHLQTPLAPWFDVR